MKAALIFLHYLIPNFSFNCRSSSSSFDMSINPSRDIAPVSFFAKRFFN